MSKTFSLVVNQNPSNAPTPDVLPDGSTLAQVTDSTPLPTDDSGPAWADSLGVSGAPVTSADASSTPLVITDAPTSGEKIVLTALFVSVDAAMTLSLRTTTDHAVMGKFILPAGGPPCQLTPRGKWKSPGANRTLELLASVSGNIYCTPIYHSEA